MSQIKLLPCPFCGGEAIINRNIVNVADVECTVCHASSPLFLCTSGDMEQKAVEAWNTRKPMEKIVEQLEKSLLLVATSKEFWNNPQNGEFVEAVISLDTAIEIVKEGGVDGM